MTPLLEIDRLRVELPYRGTVRAVLHGVDLSLAPGEAVGVVGESGSGKSMVARAITRILPRAARASGEIRFAGESVLEMNPQRLREYRSSEVGMVFQDPQASVNPVRSVGDFLTEQLRLNRGVNRQVAEAQAVELLSSIGVSEARRRLRQFPHELSGGMLQRVVIAATLLANPLVLIADEPTTALDVTTQSEVMAILNDLRRDRGLAMLFITHDIDLAASVCDRIVVMYAGAVMEERAAASIHEHAHHPYTVGLMRSRPSIERRSDELTPIPGRPRSGLEWLEDDCPFVGRCDRSIAACLAGRPVAASLGDGRVACVNPIGDSVGRR